MTDPDTTRTDLADLDRRIAEVESQIGELTGETGGNDEGALESEERAALLTNSEELRAVLENLRDRREKLQSDLG